MDLKNESANKCKGWTTGKRALLATAAFIATSGVTQARAPEIDTNGDIFGDSIPAKLHILPMDEPKSAINLLELPSPETLKNLPATVMDHIAGSPQATSNFKGAAQLLENFDHLATANVLILQNLLTPLTNRKNGATKRRQFITSLLLKKGGRYVLLTEQQALLPIKLKAFQGLSPLKGTMWLFQREDRK